MIVQLTPPELTRYSRHLLLSEIGEAGQRKLKSSSVLLIGAGGLGAPLALYLAAAGVGRIGIVEFDTVDESNLHRQILFGASDRGRHKLEAAKEKLQELNPHIRIETHPVRLSTENAREIIRGYDVVADGSDQFATKYLVNDACVLEGVPNVYASVLRFEGEVSVFGVPGGPCYRCLYASPPLPGSVPSCADAGVLGVVPGVIGTIQANEVLKLLLDIGDPLAGRLLRFDALAGRFDTFSLDRDPDCVICGDSPSMTELEDDYDVFCGIHPVQQETMPAEITVTELKALLDEGKQPFILDVRRPDEYAICNLDGTLIPLDELEDRVDEILNHRDDEMIVVHCRSGGRSAKAIEKLAQHGFTNTLNLKGGVLAWSDEVDPSMPKY